MRMLTALAACLSLAACSGNGPTLLSNVQVGGPPFASPASPPAAESSNSEPEPAGSLPVDAGGAGKPGPNGYAPNRLSVSLPTPSL